MTKSKHENTPKARPGKASARQRQHTASVEAPPPACGGIAQLVIPSPALGVMVGTEPLSRAELTKRVWAYIKRYDLQDAQDRRQIHADAQLKKVLRKDQVSMFDLTKLVNQHVT